MQHTLLHTVAAHPSCPCYTTHYMSLVHMLWFNFILSSIFIFLCFTLIITYYHTQKQRKTKTEPRIKLNHNTYLCWSLLNLPSTGLCYESLLQSLQLIMLLLHAATTCPQHTSLLHVSATHSRYMSQIHVHANTNVPATCYIPC